MSRHRYVCLLATGLIGLAFAPSSGGAAEAAGGRGAGQAVRFNRDIRPILSENCFYCHGPDSTHRKEGLRLDREEGLFGPRDNGPAVVRGKPGESELYKRVMSDDPDELMPPAKSNHVLTARQKELLGQWIEQGAPWEPQWSFVAPVRPALPEVRHPQWVRNPIDRFILARLESEGLEPAPEADRRTLARRVSLDLTGLPPAPEEVEAFVKDPAPDAYEKFVDRLLASPAYGEHRARYWLDCARYGDTHGIHIDNYREIWPYRDWVIEAFNRNQPFDQFTIEQIAGDLLPHPTLEQQIATGFHRCNITTSEGGSIPDEVAAAYAKDRADTTGTVWLGLTVGCATCHDHKFDPIKQKEYYELTAFFRNTLQRPLDGNVKDTPPNLVVPREEDRPRYALLEKQAAELQAEKQKQRTEAAKAFDAWAKGKEAKSLREPIDPVDEPLELALDEGQGAETKAVIDGHEHSLPLGEGLTWGAGPDGDGAKEKPAKKGAVKSPEKDSTKPAAKPADEPAEKPAEERVDKPAAAPADQPAGKPKGRDRAKPRTGSKDGAEVTGVETDASKAGPKAIHFGPKAFLEVPRAGDLEADEPFSMGGWVFVPAAEGSYAIASKFDVGKKGNPQGWVLEISDRNLSFRLVGTGPGDGLQIRGNTSIKVAAGKWNHVFITYDGSRELEGLALYVNGKPLYTEQPEDVSIKSSIRNAGVMRIGSDGRRDLHGGAVQEFRIYRRELSEEEVTVLSKWGKLREALDRGGRVAGPERADLLLLYLNRFDEPYRQAEQKLSDVQDGRREIRRHSPVTLVMQEKPDSEPIAHVLYRGQYDQPKEEVRPGTPASLNPFPEGAPRNRLGLAQWLIDPANPLTARVTVNRFWQEVFGQGLVRSSEDFGINGENPSHPELLDWMAVDFREGHWDVKRFVRLLVTSATYRQLALATPAKLQADPSNRLLSRGPRFRMDAEVLRDCALAEGGLLVPKIGGPSVRPYQPPGVWEAVAMLGSNTRFYKADGGEGLYRRSMYTFWKRSAPPASMEVFNAPSRESCSVRRERTNTPLQALVTMNDPQWVEAARVLAQRAMQDQPAGSDGSSSGAFDRRLDFITRRVLSRPYEPGEREICRAAFDALLSDYRAQPDAAKKLIATGESKPDPKVPADELAAWTLLASQVMNTDEALNK